jgi:hypothetical protein
MLTSQSLLIMLRQQWKYFPFTHIFTRFHTPEYESYYDKSTSALNQFEGLLDSVTSSEQIAIRV